MPFARLWLLTLAFAFLATGAAHAGTPVRKRLVLVRDKGAEQCADERELEVVVAERLGYSPFDDAALEHVQVTFAPRARGFTATLVLTDGGGTVRGRRVLHEESPRCDALLSVASLAIAIAVDPTHIARSRSAPTPPPADPPVRDIAREPALTPTPKGDATVSAPSSPPPNGRGPGLAVEASLGGLVVVGALPAASPGVDAGVALRASRFAFGLEGAFLAPATSSTPSGDVTARLLYGAVVPCLVLSPTARVDVRPCVGFALGSMVGEASHVSHSEPTALLYAAAFARLGATLWFFPSVALRPSLAARVPVTRTYLRIDDPGARSVDAWTSPTLSAELGLDLIVKVP